MRYARGAPIVASYACEDPGGRSAVTACDGPVASGSTLDTASPGTFSFTVHATDALGNAASRTVTYEIAGGSGAPTAPGDGPDADGERARDEDAGGNRASGAPGGPAAAPPPTTPAAGALPAPATGAAPLALGHML